jgi:dinuclear metal center YbgI/SA1388 family protein
VSRPAGISVRDVWQALDEHFPFAHRADWDNVGILLGDPEASVRSVLVALDVTPTALSLCRRHRIDLLVTHHPVIFTPLRTVRPDGEGQAAAHALLRMGVAVISAHTNADVAPQGVSFALARRMGLRDIRPLVPGGTDGACKVIVFVPPADVEAVLTAASAAGGGRIGAYARCSFQAPGTGTFRPLEDARPVLGRRGRDERVEEIRLETVAPASLAPAVVRAVRRAHPYEEPAIDVYPLKEGSLGGGIGAVGDLERASPLDDLLGAVFRRVRPSWIKVAGPLRKTVRRVAAVGGSGSEYAGAAREAGADLFVTADVRYHQALEAAWGGMAVADIGHGSGEKWILPEFRRVIARRFGGKITVRVHMEDEPLRPFRPGVKRREGDEPCWNK